MKRRDFHQFAVQPVNHRLGRAGAARGQHHECDVVGLRVTGQQAPLGQAGQDPVAAAGEGACVAFLASSRCRLA